jgi:hypothetical protein
MLRGRLRAMPQAKIFLRMMGAISLMFGAIYLFAPTVLTAPAGFAALGPGALTDVRATYGGFQLGVGLFWLWSAGSDARVHFALVLTTIAIGSVGASRAIGVLMDGGPNAFHAGGLIVETLLTATSGFLLFRSRQA